MFSKIDDERKASTINFFFDFFKIYNKKQAP